MKILWVKTAGLAPQDTGGKIRSYNILRQLARQHSVTLFTFYGAHADDANPRLSEVFERVVCIPLPLPEPKSGGELREYLKRLASGEPYNISKYCHRSVRESLLRLLQGDRYDVIVCDFVFAAGVIPWDWPCAKVLFAHNVESMIWKRHYEVARHPLWKAVTWREWKTMERAERRYLQHSDHVLTVSETDRQAFLRFVPASKITVVPTGVDVDYFRPRAGPQIADSLVFVGSMDWLPNEDAVCHFVENVLPLVRRHVPAVSLWVVGRFPTPRLQALAARETGVHLTGRVDDVRPFVERSQVCIVPLRIGGGTRIKIYEAMAMGKAIVSTRIGAEGLPVTHAQNVMLADAPEQFARAVVSLLHDSVLREKLGEAARAFVSDKFGWRSAGTAFEGVLARVSRARDLRAPSESAMPLMSAAE